MRETLLLPVIALTVVAALLVGQIFYLVAQAQAEARSDQAIAQANQVLRLAIDAETGQRGYLVGGNAVFLEPYAYAVRHIVPAFNDLASSAAPNPRQAQRVRQMRATYASWLDEAHAETALFQRSGDYRAYFNLHKSKDLMDGLRQATDQFIAYEDVLHGRRVRAAEWALRSTVTLTVVSVLGVGLVLTAYSRRQIQTLAADYDHALAAEVEARELFYATLIGIGDAVLVTDSHGRVTLLNSVAERLTGWTSEEAQGQDSRVVFSILNEATREVVASPVDGVIQTGVVVGLANHTILVRRDGTEIAIDDSGAPIRDAEGRLVGVVLVFRDVSERRAAERELQQSLHREHAIAATLQRSLLQAPPPNGFPGVKLGTIYEPARLEADGNTIEVGGDFLDAFSLSDTRVALVVGDVSGKGLVAAARTAEVLYTLRGLLRESGEPAEAVSRLNRILCEAQTRDEHAAGFICVSVAVLDTRDKTATLCVAGAEPPLIVRADGRTQELALHAVPLAVVSDVVYHPLCVSLDRDDTLLIVTDGITEARHGPDLFGYPRLTVLAASTRDSSPPDFARAILQGAKDFGQGVLRDDACVMAARFA